MAWKRVFGKKICKLFVKKAIFCPFFVGIVRGISFFRSKKMKILSGNPCFLIENIGMVRG